MCFVLELGGIKERKKQNRITNTIAADKTNTNASLLEHLHMNVCYIYSICIYCRAHFHSIIFDNDEPHILYNNYNENIKIYRNEKASTKIKEEKKAIK